MDWLKPVFPRVGKRNLKLLTTGDWENTDWSPYFVMIETMTFSQKKNTKQTTVNFCLRQNAVTLIFFFLLIYMFPFIV